MKPSSLRGLLGTVALSVVAAAAFIHSAHAQAKGNDTPGAVYTMTNATAGNEVVMFDRDSAGMLAPSGSAATGGIGSGGGLDPLASQGSLVMSDNGRWLLAVNAGSDDVSVFRVTPDGLELVDRVASGGVFPTSLAVFQDLVYVLNTGGGAANISGFRLDHTGHLTPIAGSTRALAAGLYSQVGFDPRGEALVITYRSANLLLVFPVGKNGTPAVVPASSPSSGAGPFAFIFDERGRLLVAEAGANAVSSYTLLADGTLTVIDPSVANGQVATCWIADARNRYSFTTNPGTNSLSSYRQHPGKKGHLTLLEAVAATGTTPLDLAATDNGRFLYAVDPAAGAIDAFQVGPHGELTDLGPLFAGLPIYAQGLAAR